MNLSLPLLRKHLPASAPASTRLQVCPPRPLSWQQPWPVRLLRWLHIPVAAWPRLDRRTAAARSDFFDALADLAGADAALLAKRLERTRSLRELWHLRAVLYNLVATQHNQAEAEARLARMNRHFPTRSPRSGFAPLDH